MANRKIFLVLGSKNISELWQNSSLSSSTAMYYFVLTNFFGMPKKAAKRITEDNSGFSAQPLPGTNIAKNNRIDHLVYHHLMKFLQGPGFDPFFDRFASKLTTHTAELDITSSWSDSDDFWKFVSFDNDAVAAEDLGAIFG